MEPVVLRLCHLREWLCPGLGDVVMRRIEKTLPHERSDAERLYLTLERMDEFHLVRAVANHVKHFDYKKQPLDGRMAILSGARCGLMRCGDSLGVTHFMIDGIEIRTLFWTVYRKYFEFFCHMTSLGEI